ncbi:hypothetical protein AJ79_07419 [Helicocarpus griseus UAMH5409]|uniref:Uncharacterized protein n=1 Tax=Helicocarpus griseus UAMH5409 TaxID=1447875 RepID=A0A2B7WV03_9EURO|nr:hypothetical protein AJ79_07419 [Helicocarpus griseus UAMH5409]
MANSFVQRGNDDANISPAARVVIFDEKDDDYCTTSDEAGSLKRLSTQNAGFRHLNPAIQRVVVALHDSWEPPPQTVETPILQAQFCTSGWQKSLAGHEEGGCLGPKEGLLLLGRDRGAISKRKALPAAAVMVHKAPPEASHQDNISSVHFYVTFDGDGCLVPRRQIGYKLGERSASPVNEEVLREPRYPDRLLYPRMPLPSVILSWVGTGCEAMPDL